LAGPGRSGASARRGLPSREKILEYVKGADGKIGKREIARAFGLRGAERGALAGLLREMAEEGLIVRGGRRRLATPDTLPPVLVVEVTGIDLDGDPLAAPVEWRGEGQAPTITILPAPRPRGRPPGIGDRALVRARKVGEGRYEGRVIRVLAGQPGRLVGVYDRGAGGLHGRVRPVERRARSEFFVTDGDALGARPGDVVIAETLPARRLGLPQARVVEVLEALDSPRAIGLLVVNSHGIPFRFPAEALAQAERARPAEAAGRADLRALDLVTIDDEDARDFDDAVFAEPDPDRDNAGGWHLVVAIADVAHYVRPGDAIDREARRRGNSVYLPDTVVPMLPEALSNDLCSLRPGEDRACLAAHLWIDSSGKTLRHRFERALMRSAARLTYRAVQAAADGRGGGPAAGPAEPVIVPLCGAFRCLLGARRRRGTLDFDLPERRVLFDTHGAVTGIEPRPRYDSHRLIEEFMIAANVAAAETLVARRAPCMFRNHDQPPLDKLEALREYLASLGYRLARSRHVTPGSFNHIIDKARGTPEEETVALTVLRAQAQAEYGPHNIGHFGLNLPRYAHFTSPIRRYADLLVHRSLIASLGLGAGGLPAGSEAEFDEVGAAISATERRAATAERDALDRFATRFLAERVGAAFAARITGVTRFGLFVELAGTGAQGLVPMREFAEYMNHDAPRHRLVGSESGRVYSLGEAVTVTLREADTVTGLLRFELEGPADPGASARRGPRRRGRG
jgi:ribonuclease R